MKSIWIGITTGLLLIAALALGAQKQNDVERQLKAAMNTELVDGNLKSAIEQYKKVAQSGNRTVAVQALLHMAECYQKLGDSESRKIYEQVVREFGDQKAAAAIARARLDNDGAGSGRVVTRQVWTGSNVDVYGSVSPDGRFMTFFDPQSGNLAVHDLSTGDDRILTNKRSWTEGGEYGQNSAFAPDGKRVAYSWDSGSFELRVIDVDGSPTRTHRVLYTNPDVEWLAPYDWSRDGKWIAVELQRKDRTTQIGLLAAGDGTLRILKSIDWRGSQKIVFSPDSRYLAFDVPVGENSRQRDVFVLAIDGSSETPALTNPADDLVVGWSPDGKHLLFASDRTGKEGIYAVQFDRGKTRGDAALLISDIGQAEVIGMSSSGTLYYGVGNGSRGFYTAAVDFNSGKLLSPLSQAAERFLGTNYQPAWSRDGQYLSYLSYGGPRRELHSVVRSLKTGQTRELRPTLTYFGFPRWSPDGRFLLAQGSDFKGRQGLYQIDVQTGNAEAIVVSEPGQVLIFPGASPDGKRIYFLRGPDGSKQTPKVLLEHDVVSSTDRVLLGPTCAGPLNVAPDGGAVTCFAIDPVSKSPSLIIVPLSGGAPKELLRFKPEEFVELAFAEWTPDGRSIVFSRNGDVWAVPVTGGEPRKIDLGTRPVVDLRIHPDGRQIAFDTREKALKEVWAVEHFLSALSEKN